MRAVTYYKCDGCSVMYEMRPSDYRAKLKKSKSKLTFHNRTCAQQSLRQKYLNEQNR